MKPHSVISNQGCSKPIDTPLYSKRVGQNCMDSNLLISRNDDHPNVHPDHGELEVGGIFNINNDGAFPEEIDFYFLIINGNKFSISITFHEAKHIVFKKFLGFCGFSNFDEAHEGSRGATSVTFKLKTAINVNELFHLQIFEFRRKSSRQPAAPTRRAT